MIKFCGALAAACLAATTASAATTVDVDNLLVPPGPIGGMSGAGASSNITPLTPPTISLEQTWTVGTSGRLAQVDLVGGASAIYSPAGTPSFTDFDVTLSILGGGTASTIGNVVLASVTKSASEVAFLDVTSFDFQAFGLYAAVGDVLTLRMTVEECPAVPFCARGWSNWYSFPGLGNTFGYAGGRMFQTIEGVTYAANEQDMNFRTWVDVPEPATWGLMILGFAGVGAALRRRAALA